MTYEGVIELFIGIWSLGPSHPVLDEVKLDEMVQLEFLLLIVYRLF